MNKPGFRTESDILGQVEIPQSALYRAQTQRAVDNFLKQERPAVEREIEALGQYSPFRKENE